MSKVIEHRLTALKNKNLTHQDPLLSMEKAQGIFDVNRW
jgi:hypothetical protein